MTSKHDDSRTGFGSKARAWFLRRVTRDKLHAAALEACGKLVWYERQVVSPADPLAYERQVVPPADPLALKAISVLGTVLQMFGRPEFRADDAARLDRLLAVVQNRDLPKQAAILRAVEIARRCALGFQAAGDEDDRAHWVEALAIELWANVDPKWISLCEQAERDENGRMLRRYPAVAAELARFEESSRLKAKKHNVFGLLAALNVNIGAMDLPRGAQYAERNRDALRKSHERALGANSPVTE
jgi:hypothetical protein